VQVSQTGRIPQLKCAFHRFRELKYFLRENFLRKLKILKQAHIVSILNKFKYLHVLNVMYCASNCEIYTVTIIVFDINSIIRHIMSQNIYR
jgi:hypothetical protein